MANLFEINSRRVFSNTEANELLPVIYRITEEAQKTVRNYVNQLKALPDKNSPKALQIEAEINVIVEKWNSKIQRLGGKPKGLWLADFDNGSGYFCWKYPETEIGFFHGYREGFSGRIPLSLLKDSKDENSLSPN